MIKIGDTLEGKLSINTSGSGYLNNTELAKDIYIHRSNTNKGLHLDDVRVKIVKGQGRELEGVVTDVISRFRNKFVGRIEISDKFAYFIADSNKMSTDIFIPLSDLNGALQNQKVVVEMTSWKEKAKKPNGRVVEILGYAGDNDVEIHSILHEYDLPYNFTEDVLAEADAIDAEIKPSDIESRRDMRNVITIGIDPINSKDADDTIGIEWINGECFVSINIADVTHYVRPDTALDKEAYQRGNSVYLVDRCVPMLPHRLSNNICSLKSGRDKLSFSAIFKLDKNGKVLSSIYEKSIINVNKDYTYEEAQSVIEGGVREEFKETDAAILELNKIAKKLREQRRKNDFLDIDKQEINFVLDKDNKPIDIVFKISKDSNKLIEEFMLLANKEVATFIKSKDIPCINRVHETPDIEKLNAIKNFVKQFGYKIQVNENANIKRELNKLLSDCKGTAEESMISNLVIRAQQKAIYSTKNLGHYGLGFENYATFTSPIRKYSDIILHRLLMHALGNRGYPIK